MFVGKDFTPGVIDEVKKDSPAEVAGLVKNDIIVEIDNNKVESILDISKLIAMSTSEYIDFKVLRSDNEILFKIKPNLVESQDNLGNKINKDLLSNIEQYLYNYRNLKNPSKKIVEWCFCNKLESHKDLIVYRKYHNYDHFKDKYNFNFSIINNKYGSWNNNKVIDY